MPSCITHGYSPTFCISLCPGGVVRSNILICTSYLLFFSFLLGFCLLIKPWGLGLGFCFVLFSLSFISIHSLLAERDSWESNGDNPDGSPLNCLKMRQNLLPNLTGQEKVKNKK